MKTFEDLIFKLHPAGSGVQAVIDFDNGYSISVVRLLDSHKTAKGPCGVAILYKGDITHANPTTGYVLGQQSERAVNTIMEIIQAYGGDIKRLNKYITTHLI